MAGVPLCDLPSQGDGPCLRCGKMAALRCGTCWDPYCNVACQAAHWPQHKEEHRTPDDFFREIVDTYCTHPRGYFGPVDDEGVDLDYPWHTEEQLEQWWDWQTRLRPCGRATQPAMRKSLRSYNPDCVKDAIEVRNAYNAMADVVEVTDKYCEGAGFYFVHPCGLALLIVRRTLSTGLTWEVRYDEADPDAWAPWQNTHTFPSIEELSEWIDSFREPMVKSAAKDS